MLFIVLTCLLLVLVVLLYIDKTRLSAEHLHYSKVPRVYGEFAAHPSVASDNLVTVNQCSNKGFGALGQQPCVFGNINSLQEAVDVCNQYIVVCPAFVYDTSTKTVTIVEKPEAFVSGARTNLDGYIRQIEYSK